MAMYQLSRFGLKLTKINSNHADVRRHTFLEKSCCTVSLYLLMLENVPVSVDIFLNGYHNIVYKLILVYEAFFLLNVRNII